MLEKDPIYHNLSGKLQNSDIIPWFVRGLSNLAILIPLDTVVLSMKTSFFSMPVGAIVLVLAFDTETVWCGCGTDPFQLVISRSASCFALVSSFW
jgi:hypothetical protein